MCRYVVEISFFSLLNKQKCLSIKVVIGEAILKLFLTFYKAEGVSVLGDRGSHGERRDRQLRNGEKQAATP